MFCCHPPVAESKLKGFCQRVGGATQFEGFASCLRAQCMDSPISTAHRSTRQDGQNCSRVQGLGFRVSGFGFGV